MIYAPSWRENYSLSDGLLQSLIPALVVSESLAQILGNCLKPWSVNLATQISRNQADSCVGKPQGIRLDGIGELCATLPVNDAFFFVWE